MTDYVGQAIEILNLELAVLEAQQDYATLMRYALGKSSRARAIISAAIDQARTEVEEARAKFPEAANLIDLLRVDNGMQ